MALTRSQQMARIKGKDTLPERLLRKALSGKGLRYRLHWQTPWGRIDVAFPRRRVAVFVDGCFWHGCPTHFVRPKNRRPFWDAKIAGNQARDRRQDEGLAGDGWRVLRFWEHEVEQGVEAVAERIHAVCGEAP